MKGSAAANLEVEGNIDFFVQKQHLCTEGYLES